MVYGGGIMPDLKVVLELGQNIAVLMLLVFVASHIFYSFKKPVKPSDQLSLGLIFSFITFIGMLIPVEFSKDVIIDGRVLILSIAGFFGGTTVALAAALPVCIYRLFLGGAGAMAGILEIIFAAAIGIVMHKLRGDRTPRLTHFVVMGVLVTMGSMLSGLALPKEIFLVALNSHAPAMLIFFPVGTVFIGILFSIEGAKQEAMAQSREKEEKYMTMIRNLSEGFFNVSLDGTILNHNLAFNRVFGFAEDVDLSGKKTVDFFENPQDREKYIDLLQREGVARDYLVRIRLANSTIRTCRINSRLVKDDIGAPVRIEGTVSDITEQIRTQKELHEARALLQAAMDQSPVGIAIADAPDGRLRYVNEAGIKIGGRSRRELAENVASGQYVERWHVLDKDGGKLGSEKIPINIALSEGHDSSREMVLVRPDGEHRSIFVNAAPVRDESGHIIAAVAVFMDISDLRAAEESLFEKEEFLRTTYRAAENVAFISTKFTDDDRLIVDFSPGAEKIFGYSREEVLDQSIAIVYPPSAKPRLPAIQKILQDGKFFRSSETELMRKSGEAFPALFSVYPRLDSKGKVVGSLGVVLDISIEKEMERKLRQSEKMEAIGQLAGGIAHDFNNMLGVIKGYADLLIASLGKDMDELAEYARNINRAANRSSSLTAQLLAFARRGQYQPSNLDIHQVISETITMLEHTINKNIEIHEILKAAPSTVKGDSNQIINALLNMAINASDAMPDGGKLIFSTDVVELSGKECPADSGLTPGSYLEILVSDTGKGMTEEVQKHIYEPFFTTKPKGKGTGMGLAAVYGIIRLHRGDISVRSVPDRGSTFRILLPLSEDQTASTAAPTAPPVPAALLKDTSNEDHNILVVDDEKLFRKLAEDLLAKLGYNFHSCSSGREALDFYRLNWKKIDLVILDMIMPGLNGKQVFAELKKINPAVKAVIASGFSAEDDTKEVLEEGVLAFIEKPFATADFNATISKALSL